MAELLKLVLGSSGNSPASRAATLPASFAPPANVLGLPAAAAWANCSLVSGYSVTVLRPLSARARGTIRRGTPRCGRCISRLRGSSLGADVGRVLGLRPHAGVDRVFTGGMLRYFHEVAQRRV